MHSRSPMEPQNASLHLFQVIFQKKNVPIVRALRPLTLAPIQCREGERRVFTDQADIALTKREAP